MATMYAVSVLNGTSVGVESPDGPPARLPGHKAAARELPLCQCGRPTTSGTCSGCSTPLCPSCSKGNRCDACFLVVQFPATNDQLRDEFALQKDERRNMKSGTTKLLGSGRRQLSELIRHGVSPRDMLEMSVCESLRGQTTHLRDVVRKPPLLIEWCCEHDSELGRIAASAGWGVYRADGSDDVHTAGTDHGTAALDRMINKAKASSRPIVMWASNERRV